MAALTAVSKLASRIKKKEENGEYEDKRMTSQSSMTPASITTNNTTDTVSAAVNNASLAFQRRSADKSNTRALEMIIETLKADVQRLTEEKDVLLREKKSWSIKIQDDNLKLAKMLKVVTHLNFASPLSTIITVLIHKIGDKRDKRATIERD